MNKKGLILIFLFVLSGIGFAAVTNAESTSKKVDVTLSYVPSAYVPHDSVYLEFDSRFLADNNIYGLDDEIYFSYFYDVALTYWESGYYVTTGSGLQPDFWYKCPENNASLGYQGSDKYNITRVLGAFELILDDYGLGWGGFDIGADAGTYQKVKISLDIGWHYLTIIGAELVSDGNHTEFHWEYAKDQVKFYVAETRHDSATLQQEAWGNYAIPEATAVLSEDLPEPFHNYTVTDWPDAYQPYAYVESDSFVQLDEGTEEAMINTTIEVVYNSSDTEFMLAYNASYPQGYYVPTVTAHYASIGNMGPHTYAWIVNDKPLQIDTDDALGLLKGNNIIIFALWGMKADSWSAQYAWYYQQPFPVMEVKLAIARVFVGEPESTGPGFGIFISVSMLGLVAALYIMRRRK